MSDSRRSGFSLMEVLIATALLLGSMVVLGELAALGRRQAQSAQDYATAQLLCENKMNEILAGLAPLATIDAEPFPVETDEMLNETGMATTDLTATTTGTRLDPSESLDDTLQEPTEMQEAWVYSVNVESLDYPGLVSVRVTVWRSTGDSEEEPRHVYSLVRWMRSSTASTDTLDMNSSFETPFSESSSFFE